MLSLLLLEDDPVSRAFLVEVLAALPARVHCAGSCADAESLAHAGGHALWLFDANLPDGSGADLLGRLRESGLTTPALALTAESFRERLLALSEAGFAGVLQKPITAAALLAAIAGHLHAASAPAASPTNRVWDDAQALAAVGGRAESARALRRLFLDELPGQIECVRIAFAAPDPSAVRDQLHRLKASCGFVGAQGLLTAVNRLSTAMDDASLQDFLDHAARQLRAPDVTAGAA
jgi:CheY-like chemotaxis protein/HPt (histidine-containing phosphotransfer) domain-containing protein